MTLDPRRGFSLTPLIGFLALALVLLVAWKLMIQLDHIPKLRPDAERLKGKAITTSIVTVLVVFAVSGGLGALGYFAFRRSESASQIGIVVPLALGVATFSYQHYRYQSGAMTRPTASATGAGGRSAPAPSAQHLSVPAPPPNPFPSSRSGERPPGPPPSTVEAPPRMLTQAPPARPAPAENPAARQALESLRAEMDRECSTLAEQGGALFDAMAQVPKPLKQEIEARLKLAQDVQEAAGRLHERLRDVSTVARERLREAGLDTHEATSASIQFSASSDFAMAGAAAFQLQHFAEQAAAESNILRDNLGRWVLRQAKFSTSDKDLERRYESARFFVEAALSRRDDMLRPLRR
jgi:hypothetical protein